MITAYDIQTAIAKIITDTLAEEGLSDVRVHDTWMLNFNPKESGALLMITAPGPNRGKIHAWMIGLTGKLRTRPEPAKDVYGAGRLKTVGPARRDISYVFKVWCFVELDDGEVSSLTSSERQLDEETELIADAISLSPLLGLDATNEVQGHQELQFEKIIVSKFGEKLANVAQGTMVVKTFRPLSI